MTVERILDLLREGGLPEPLLRIMDVRDSEDGWAIVAPFTTYNLPSSAMSTIKWDVLAAHIREDHGITSVGGAQCYSAGTQSLYECLQEVSGGQLAHMGKMWTQWSLEGSVGGLYRVWYYDTRVWSGALANVADDLRSVGFRAAVVAALDTTLGGDA